jgi:serine/threonine-protein kinase
MAHVYQGLDLNLQREVALKVLREDLIGDPAFLDRFLQEARAAANLVHPGIVTVYDFGHDPSGYFMVMEYVQGTDLKTLLRRRGRLSVEQAVDIAIQVCAGAGYAHRAGLVHCDLKPQNILVSPEGRAKITDFGIARALASIHPEESSEVVWGSPQYFSPEQAAGGPPSPASDVYGIGVMLFEMLTGRLPFETDDPAQLAEMHLQSAPPAPRSLNPEIPAALEQIILKVLSKEPAGRYRTADQLGHVLANFGGKPAAPPAAVLPEGSPRPESPELQTVRMDAAAPVKIDWIAVGLGLLAFIAVGGLIPLWLFIALR